MPQDDTKQDAQPILAQAASNFGVAIDGTTVVLAFSTPQALVLPSGQLLGLNKIPSVAVSMSPVLAKDLVKVLGNVIKDYEKEIGPIPVLTEPKQS